MPRNRVIAKTGEAIVQNITPDVCLTPLGPLVLPLPYAIIARFDLSVEVEGSVSIHGFDAFTMRSRVASVTGNEAGTKGGIISGVNLGFCRPKSSANTIQIGGEFIIQHTDLFWMNCNGPDGPGNCVGKVVYVQVESFVWADANACSFGHADGGDMDYRRFDEALDYMFNEMIKNQDSSTVTAIKDLLSPPKRWYEWLYYKPNTDTVSALALFWGKVHQGGDWDHKGVLDERLGLGSNPGGKDYYFPFRGDINNEYYYDIWSNIHYGYVGSASGFSPQTLQFYANSRLPGAGTNDKADEVTVQLGIELWNRYGKLMTKKQLHQAIIDTMCDLAAAAAEQRGDGGSGVVIPATNRK